MFFQSLTRPLLQSKCRALLHRKSTEHRRPVLFGFGAPEYESTLIAHSVNQLVAPFLSNAIEKASSALLEVVFLIEETQMLGGIKLE